MTIELDHSIVSARNAAAAAETLAGLLGVAWAAHGLGPFAPVYVNERLTLDFIDDAGEFPVQHFCFKVSEAEFDAILGRIRDAGIDCKSTLHGPVDHRINTTLGGRIVCWNVLDGHQWEILAVSCARRPAAGGT